MEPNWDPGVKKFFVKILNSISITLFWMIGCALAGIYFELGTVNGKPILYPVIFYTLMITTLILLVRYLYKTWKNG